MSLRKVQVLIAGLPKGSALARAYDPENAAWSLTDHLLAGVIDTLNSANWQRAGNDKAPRPKRLPRPGVLDEAAQRASDTERKARAFLDRQAKREAG